MSRLLISLSPLPLLALTALACNGEVSVTVGASTTATEGTTESTASSTTNPTTATGSESATQTVSGSVSETGTSVASDTEPTLTSTTNPGTVTDTEGTSTVGTTLGTTGTTDVTATDSTDSTDGTDGTTSTGTTGDTDTTDGTSTTGDTTGTTGDTTGVIEDPCPCADVEVPLDNGIFVLSDNAELYKYLPDENSFENLGALGCDMPNTFSMAVDRAGFAWVMFAPPNGELRKVDVTNPANCEDPGYTPGQEGITRFGMAFVTEDQFNTCDRLYGNTYDGIGGFGEGPDAGTFLTVDPDTQVLETLGLTTFNGAELTGTGDGRTFMFGGVNPAKLVEVNKQNGEYLDTIPLGDLNLTSAFAFAFFAGDFYFFTESGNPGSNSKVTHFDYDDSDNNGIQDLTIVNNNAPIRIVGAGVSTCAPFLPQ